VNALLRCKLYQVFSVRAVTLFREAFSTNFSTFLLKRFWGPKKFRHAGINCRRRFLFSSLEFLDPELIWRSFDRAMRLVLE
jgi:hypothetical protein